MKKKNIKKILFASFLVPTTVFALSTATTGEFRLTMGQVEESSAIRVNLKYPYLQLDNNKSNNGIFSSVLRKSTLGIYSNKQRKDRVSAGTGNKHLYFNDYGTGTYKVNIIGESGTTAFDYAFTSSNSNS